MLAERFSRGRKIHPEREQFHPIGQDPGLNEREDEKPAEGQHPPSMPFVLCPRKQRALNNTSLNLFLVRYLVLARRIAADIGT